MDHRGIKPESCPICKGAVPNGKSYLHINISNGPHGRGYETYCDNCHVRLRRIIFGEEDGKWSCGCPLLNALVREVDSEELIQIENTVSLYSGIMKHWKKFLEQRGPTDSVWRFRVDDSGEHGLTIRRGDHLIGDFSGMGVALEEMAIIPGIPMEKVLEDMKVILKEPTFH